MRSIRRSAAATALLATMAALVLAAPARASMQDDGRKMIQSMSANVIQVLKRGASRREKEARFARVFHQHFDAATIARWVMGRAWRVATPAQRAAYVKAFNTYVVKTYTVQLSKYDGETLKVVGAEKDGKGVVVTSHIVDPARRSAPIVVKWRLRPTGGVLKVRDVVIDNISMSLNQRREFDAVYRRAGSVDGLIKAIEQKIAELDRR